jgi:bacterioferritin (cytochrome b1)
MQLEKIYEKVKKYLLLIEEDDIEKKKIEKLTKNIEEKISKIKNKLKFVNDVGDENRLKEEMAILKKFKKQLKKKK